jgi:hypothetical protein
MPLFQRACLRASIVIEAWPGIFSLDDQHGPLSKAVTSRWAHCQYLSTGRMLQASNCNGAVSQQRLMVMQSLHQLPSPRHIGITACPMANALRPCFIPRRAYRHDQTVVATLAESDPAPALPGSRIRTHKGARQILSDEVARSMGCPRSWTPWYRPGAVTQLPSGFCQAVRRTTCAVLWESAR